MATAELKIRPESPWAMLKAEAEQTREAGGTVDAVIELSKLVRASVIQLQIPEGEELPEGALDAGFFKLTATTLEGQVLVTQDEFHEALNGALEQVTGVFSELDRETLLGGPSYIELGRWLGDQGIAIGFIGLGALLDFWDVASPQGLGITGEDAAQLLGMGFLFPELKSGSPLIRDGFEEQSK